MAEESWRRLQRWRDARSIDGDEALAVLADIGELRRGLDQAELAAVRAARQQGRSWTEIATQLGITRQSAWEKWRDLDGEEAVARSAGAVSARARARTVVPNVVGRSWQDARTLLWEVGLVAANADPDSPTPAPDELGWSVTDQSPESGARVPAGATVRLWLLRNGGSAGVREPRLPGPRSGEGRAMRPEPSDRAAG